MNKIEINIPEGFEIDVPNSNLSEGFIQFKPIEKKRLNYEDIAKFLFKNKNGVWLTAKGKVAVNDAKFTTSWADPNNATSKEQLECLMAYNKLRNVAEYLNKGWKADWNNPNENKYQIYYDYKFSKILIDTKRYLKYSSPYFVSKELAEDAITILGEEEIKKALFIY